MTFRELDNLFREHNKEKGIIRQFEDKHPLKAVIVFKSSNWEEQYSLEDRSYIIQSDNKYFISGMCGNSIFSKTLSGKDEGIRLDYYLNEWEIEDIYLLEEK